MEGTMNTNIENTVGDLAELLMRAVVRSGVLRGNQDIDIALRVMREELKELLMGDRYIDERKLAEDLPNGYDLAWASLVVNTIHRIHEEIHGGAAKS
jgi:hypothetical protein